MENKVKLLIELGLQRDEDQGDVAVVAFDFPRSVAERVCREQESCQLLSECGDLTRLLNAYAVMNGYQCAWFVSAKMEERVELNIPSPDNKYFPRDLIIEALRNCSRKDCGSCPLYHFALENGEYKTYNCLQLAGGLAKGLADANDDLTAENTSLRESVLFLQTELEEARKSVQAHELAGKLFEMKNTQLEKKLEAAYTERDMYNNQCKGLKNKLAIAVGYKNAGIPDNAAAAQAEAEMWLRVTLHEKKSVRRAIYKMRDELKAGGIHFDGISLKAIPFDSVDAVAEKVIAEMGAK